MSHREPMLTSVAVSELRPTQITVGLREVAEKRRRWQEIPDDKRSDFLGQHMIPVLLGPKGRRYVIDHHHLALALHQEGVEKVATTVVADLSRLDKPAFWIFVDNRSWCHPYDAEGLRQDFAAIPKTLMELVDDPYRSLAGELLRAGGFAKETAPFDEFLWADFLRRRIKPKAVEKDFAAALIQAMTLARSKDADFLPGWSGPSPEA